MNLKTVWKVGASIFILFISLLLGLNILLTIKYGKSIDDVNETLSEEELCKINDNSNESSDLEEECKCNCEETESGSSEDITNNVEHEDTFRYKGLSIEEIFTGLRNYVSFDLIIPKDFELKDNVANLSYVISIEDETKDFERVEFDLVKDDFEMFAMEGSYGTGGTCTESYEVETNLSSCTVNVCIYDYKIGVGEDDERETSNVVSFEFENNLNYQFIFDGDYEKSFVEDIFENMMKYSL